MEVRGISQGGQTTLDTMQSDKLEEKIFINSQANEDKNPVNKTPSEKDIKELKTAVNKLNKFMEGDGTKIVYEMHDKFRNDVMIKIVDTKTGKVLSEVPPKKILDMVAKMCEMMGVLFDEKA